MLLLLNIRQLMNSARRLFLAFGLIGALFGWLGSTTPVFACSCAMATPSEQFENATAVFVGTVNDISADGYDNIVDFDVSESRKGLNTKSVSVTTRQQGASCGFNFEKDREYIVYAYDDRGGLGTGICNGTSLLVADVQNGDSEIDITSSPTNPAIEAKKSENSIAPIVIAVTISFIAGVLATHAVERRKKIN